MQLLAEGLPNKIIATRLHITEHTAKFHVSAILTKLGAASRTEAVTTRRPPWPARAVMQPVRLMMTGNWRNAVSH